MATLIAANYQSTTVTGYGGMGMSCGTLKANTLYTLKCRYKYTKNTSSMPQIMCYNSNWTYTGGIYDNTDDGIMKTRIITFTSYPSAIEYYINCYAWSFDNQNNGVGGKTGVLEVDWYELWEGDATNFSLTDAIALSEDKTEDDFVSIGGHPTELGSCTNPSYFSGTEPREAMRSWMGYYYKTQSTTSYGDWTYSYTGYTSAERSRSVITYDHYSNGKKVQISTSTQVEGATLTYGNWSYNWVTTGNSTRSRTVTYTWGDNSTTTKTQTQTGGARYIVLDNFSDGKSEGSVHEFSAAGGSITARTVSHDYWPDTSGTQIQTVVITGVTTTCTGFTCSTSGSTVTITAASKGTNVSDANQATITSTKSGWVTRSYGTCKQAANTVSYSYGTPQMKGVKWSALIPAGGGTATPSITSYNQVRTNTYTSGSSNKTNITSGASISFARAQIVQDVDPEFYNGANSINIYDNAGSGKTTLTRVTSGYPSGIPNNSGVAYRIQNTGAGPSPNLGGFYHNYGGTSGQTYMWTFDAYIPTGYTVQHNHNSLGSGGSFTWRTPTSGAGEWRTYSVEVYFGTSNSSAFFCSLVGTAGSSSAPVTWWIANSKICKISNVTAPNGGPSVTSNGKVTLGSRGTTTGSIAVDVYGAVLGTITMNGKTGKFVAAPSQQANAITSYGTPTFDMWYVGGNGSAANYAAAGGDSSLTPSINSFKQTVTYTSAATKNITDYTGASISYKSVLTAGAASVSVNTSTGVVSVGSLGTTIQASTYPIIRVQCSITLNGKTGTDNGVVGQDANSYSDSGGGVTYGAWGGGAISFSKTSLGAAADSCTVTIQPWSRTKTTAAVIRTYSSGSTSTVSNAFTGTEYYNGTVAVSENGSYTSLSATSYTASSSAKTLTLSKSTCGTTAVAATTVTVTANPNTDGPGTTTKGISQVANAVTATDALKVRQFAQNAYSINSYGGTTTISYKIYGIYTYTSGDKKNFYPGSGSGSWTTTHETKNNYYQGVTGKMWLNSITGPSSTDGSGTITLGFGENSSGGTYTHYFNARWTNDTLYRVEWTQTSYASGGGGGGDSSF